MEWYITKQNGKIKTKMMKAIHITVMMLFFTGSLFAQSVGISNNGSSPNASAMLDLSSTTKGFLPPRMAYTERNAIASPPAGLMVWCSDCQPAGEMQVYNGTAWTNVVGGDASIPFEIGQHYKEGIIFYLDETGLHGLMTSPFDESPPPGSGGFVWAIPDYQNIAVPGGTLPNIGSGYDNTNKISNQNGPGMYAAERARMAGGGYWSLPSRDELDLLYFQRNVIGGFTDGFYWGSTEYNLNMAFGQNFMGGSPEPRLKSAEGNVRAVRTF